MLHSISNYRSIEKKKKKKLKQKQKQKINYYQPTYFQKADLGNIHGTRIFCASGIGLLWTSV